MSQGIISIINLLATKELKAKDKTQRISKLLLEGEVNADDIVKIAAGLPFVEKANIVEAMEHASRSQAKVITKKAFVFVIDSLNDDAPRVKWESARVIGNTAHLFPKLLKKAVIKLLVNTEHKGMVVRWSAASALSAIIQTNTHLNKELIPAVLSILEWEQDNAIKKIYSKALKKHDKNLQEDFRCLSLLLMIFYMICSPQ